MRALCFALAGSLGLLVACDSAVPDTGEPPPDRPPVLLPEVRTDGRAGLTPRTFNLFMNNQGRVFQRYTCASPTCPESTYVEVLNQGALWMAGQQEGTLRVATHRPDMPTYDPCPDATGRVYVVDGHVNYSSTGWPADLGAPTSPDGAPRAFGDQMVWTSACTTARPGVTDLPFTGVRVNAAIFGFEDRENMMFVRYEIRNESAAPITDAYAGFWADPDLASRADSVGAFENLIGFDAPTGLGYVYFSTHRRAFYGGGPVTPTARRTVAGVIVLESPGNAPLAAYRIMDKLDGPYGEFGLRTSQPISRALRGLDNEGNPMVDPTTGAVTTFAYTGDPVAQTGWLDGFDNCEPGCVEGGQVGEELRQLTSAGPFSLAAGETTVLTVAYIYQQGSSLASGLSRLRDEASALRAQSSLWRYPPSN